MRVRFRAHRACQNPLVFHTGVRMGVTRNRITFGLPADDVALFVITAFAMGVAGVASSFFESARTYRLVCITGIRMGVHHRAGFNAASQFVAYKITVIAVMMTFRLF